MKKQRLFFWNMFIGMVILTIGTAEPISVKELKIEKIELGYPCPGIPFYHFKAELELPRSSIIEIEATVNGKVLRCN